MILTPLQDFKDYDLDRRLAEFASSPRENGLLVVFPTNRRMREFNKILSVSYPGVKISTATIRSLALKLARQLDPGFRIVPDEIHEIFVLNVIDELKKTEVVPQLTRGTIKLIKNTISEFKENGTNLQTLLAEIASLNPISTEKAAFLSRVWAKLDEKLRSSGMKEIGDVYLHIQAKKTGLPEAFISAFPGISEIFMQNFIELTQPEVEIIEGIATAVQNRIYLDFDYNTANHNLFEKIVNIHTRLTTAGFKGFTSKTEDLAPGFQKHIKEYLFSPSKPQPLQTDNIFEIEANDLYQEVTIVAKEIKSLLLTEKDLNAKEVCVLFHRISAFTPWIRAIFDSYGLPVNITDRYKTGDFASVSGLIDLLTVHKSHFGHNEILRVLSNPLFRSIYGDPVHFKRACSYIKVGSGYHKLIKLLQEALISLPSTIDEKDDNEEPDDSDIRTSLKSALSTVKRLHDDLAPLTAPQEPGMFSRNMRDLIAKTGYLPHFLDGKGGGALYNIRALSSFIRSATRLFEVMQDYDKGIGEFDEYFNILIDLSQETRFNLVEQPETGVMITTPDEIRGLKFKHLFICALNEGDFPTRYKPEIFKYDGATEQIKRHSAGERLLFYQALSAWRAEKNCRLYLTNSRIASKKENVESFFKREMKALFTITKIERGTFERLIFNNREVWEKGAWKNTPVEPEMAEVTRRIDENHAQSNLLEDKVENQFAGYINFDPYDETGPGLPVIRKVNQPFSPTALESYGACPYKFFVKHILKVEPADDHSEELDAKEFGTLLHEILRNFHTRLNEENKTLRNCSDEQLKTYLKEMIDIAGANSRVVLKELLDTESFISAEKILGIAGDQTMSILWQYLLESRKNDSGLEPALFENHFRDLKLTGLNSEKITAPYQISLHGTIDRIDIDPVNKLYKVIDYKSGSKDYPAEDVKRGSRLQIPVYLMATVKGSVSKLPEDHSYLFPQIFSLKYDEESFGTSDVRIIRSGSRGDTPGLAKSHWDEVLAMTEENIKKFVLGIFEGKFPLTGDPARDDKACKFCDYKELCRVKEHILLEASQNPLEPASQADPMALPT